MEKMYLMPSNMRDALIQFLASQMTMAVAEEPVSHLRALQEFRRPKTPEETYRDLLECRLSGQINDERWAAHLEDEELKNWIEVQVLPNTAGKAK
jgi:hypothetical protein